MSRRTLYILVLMLASAGRLAAQVDDCGGFFSPWAPGIHQRHVTTGWCGNSPSGPFDFGGYTSQGWCHFDDPNTLRGDELKCFSSGCTYDIVVNCGGWKVGNLSCTNSFDGSSPHVGTENVAVIRSDGSSATERIWLCATEDSDSSGHGQQCECVNGDSTHAPAWSCGTFTRN